MENVTGPISSRMATGAQGLNSLRKRDNRGRAMPSALAGTEIFVLFAGFVF